MAEQTKTQSPATQPGQSSTSQDLFRQNDQHGMMRYSAFPSPFDLIRRFSEDVDRLFATSFGTVPMGTSSSSGRASASSNRSQERSSISANMGLVNWVPSVEITTRGDDLVVTVDLPGVEAEDIQVEFEDHNLIVRGRSYSEQENKAGDYWYTERSYGTFYRSIPLPGGVNVENATAALNNGVLEITLSGAARSIRPQRRQLKVQTNQQAAQQSSSPQRAMSADNTQTAQQTTGTDGSYATPAGEQPGSST